ncbi:tautomerase family protein [Hydrogenophaga sp. RWCD_12]|uniref:tautomerase family protein n=1 Tax=Hydrogenophaga sp. RWCD_12 TaxID=3391190 RepID=UPI0039854432
MPFIDVKIIEGVLPDDKKHALIAAITEAVVQVGGEGFRPMTRCVIQEIRSGWWGAGGKPLTTEDARPR